MHATHTFSPPLLTGNLLKLIAAATMLIDHIGLMFFPQYPIFRMAGRLAYPIFAFMIAEGCHYTGNRLRYFLTIFLLGVFCQIASGDRFFKILLTFSCSIPLIYLLQEWKSGKGFVYLLLFSMAVAMAFVLNRHIVFDYGFWGILVPVFVSLACPRRGEPITATHHLCRTAFLGIGLLLLAHSIGSIQYYSLLALPLLLLYSGERGKGNFKYAFYIFYPLHLAVLQAIAWLHK